MKKPIFAVMYRVYVAPEKEDQYIAHWKQIASYFVTERGALGSTLHKSADGMWVAYSKWPDKQTRDASWPQAGEAVNVEIPAHIQEAILNLKQCVDPDQVLPEICMELVEEVL